MALSSDPSTAERQILADLGFGSVSDPKDVLKVASAQQNRELALLGYFGVPGSYEADYSLFERYYADQGPSAGAPSAGRAAAEGRKVPHDWAPKNPNLAIWADYLANG